MRLAIPWRSLRFKIIAWSFVPTAIILAAAAWVTFSAYQRVAEDLVIERNQELARLSAGQLATELSGYSDVLDAVARTASLTDAQPASLRNVLAQASARLIVFDAGVVALNNAGVLVAAEPERPDLLGQDWSGRSDFRQMVRTPGPIFSEVLSDGPGGGDVVELAVPVIGDRGELLGTLVGMFRLKASAVSAFYGGILKLRIGDEGSNYLVDRHGRVIYHTEQDLIGEDLSQRAAVRQALAEGSGSERTWDETGRQLVAGFATVPGTPWSLITEEDLSALMAPGEAYRRFLTLLLVLGMVVPALVVMVGVRRITQPLSELISAAQEVAAGNFGRTIVSRSGDEINELADQFNLMSAQLQESYTNLEQRVADRTRELAALHAISEVVSGSLDLDDILRAALEKTLEVTGMEVGAAYRFEEDQTLTHVAQCGLSEPFVHKMAVLMQQAEESGLLKPEGRPVARPVISLPDGELRQLLYRQGLQLIVCIPLVAKGRRLGRIDLGAQSLFKMAPEELSLLAGIGQQVGVAVENARLYERAEEAAAVAERSRLARDLHDAVTQTLFSASLIAEVLPRIWDRNADEGHRRLAELRQLTRGALAEMRTLLLELRPSALTEGALSDLLRQLGEAITGRARLPVTVTVEPTPPLSPEVQVGLYRIAQEALNNIAKHSGATQAWVALRGRPPAGIELCIRDDGHGFDPGAVPAGHLGLGIMRERAQAIGAELLIDSQVDEGTEIRLIWPAPPAN